MTTDTQTTDTQTADTQTARPEVTVHVVVDSPLGPLTLVADGGVLAGVYMTDQSHLPGTERFGAEVGVGDDAALAAAARELAEYFAGERTAFDVPLHARGTDFQRRVWDRLCEIPFGDTTTYGAIAADLGLPPGASRAVGAAIGRNPLCVVVPCHRVIGASGALTGYAGGIDRKVWLLENEGVDL